MKSGKSLPGWLVVLILFFWACQGGGENRELNLSPSAHKVKAEEVIQTSAYTYVRVSAEGRDYWTAISKNDIKTGGTYYWSIGYEMRDFTSKELKRTFRSIYFIQDFSALPITLESHEAATVQGSRQNPVDHKGIAIQKAKGELTVADLYSEKENYNGKTVRIRGEIVKFAGRIMNRNWIHIQDGTKYKEHYDLAITSLDSAGVGCVAEFEGRVTLNKDLGAGYFYDILIEDAKIRK